MATKIALGFALTLTLVDAVSNHQSFTGYGGFQPRYYRMNDQLAEASERVESNLEKIDTSADSSGNSLLTSPEQRTQRFGITAYGGSGVQGGYPSAGGSPGLYGPMKIDLGGVLIGSLLGLGAVLILPKLVHAFSYSYGGGGYGRSVEADVSTFTAMLTKLDDMLEKNNVDSASCAQRIACSYVQSAYDNMAIGNATEVDHLISTLSENSLISYMLDGTAIKQGLEAGKDVHADCHSLYPRCKLDKQTVMKILTNVLPS